MSFEFFLKSKIPEPVKKIFNPIRNRIWGKHGVELSFWRTNLELEKGEFENSFYEKLMLAMAGEPNDRFLAGKIVADFGCGPRGSLVWARSASLRIGIDVLADQYADAFTSNIISHGMIYLKSTEKVIPLPSNFVDVVFTLNAIDHVDNFALICAEIMRVLKSGGHFIGSLNLEEPSSITEPQQLNEEIIKKCLLDDMEILSYRKTRKGPPGNAYAPFFEKELPYESGQEGFLWVRARKS